MHEIFRGGVSVLHENLRLKRKERGLSQEELASRLHVVRQTISKWEKGMSVPDSEQNNYCRSQEPYVQTRLTIFAARYLAGGFIGGASQSGAERKLLYGICEPHLQEDGLHHLRRYERQQGLYAPYPK